MLENYIITIAYIVLFCLVIYENTRTDNYFKTMNISEDRKKLKFFYEKEFFVRIDSEILDEDIKNELQSACEITIKGALRWLMPRLSWCEDIPEFTKLEHVAIFRVFISVADYPESDFLYITTYYCLFNGYLYKNRNVYPLCENRFSHIIPKKDGWARTMLARICKDLTYICEVVDSESTT